MIWKHLIQFRCGIWQMFLSENQEKVKVHHKDIRVTTKTTGAPPATGVANPCATCVCQTYSWTWTNLVFCNHFQILATEISSFLFTPPSSAVPTEKCQIFPLRLTITTRWKLEPSTSPRGFLCRCPPYPAGLGKALSTPRQVLFPSNSPDQTYTSEEQLMEQNADSLHREGESRTHSTDSYNSSRAAVFPFKMPYMVFLFFVYSRFFLICISLVVI